MNKPYSASAYQVCIGYKYLRGENLPGNLPFDQAAHDLSNDFGFDRVRAILTGIPNYRAACTATEADALAAAKNADPGASTVKQTVEHRTGYQVRMAYKYLRGADLPDMVPEPQAFISLSTEFGAERVNAIVTALPNIKLPGSDAKAMTAAKKADPGAQP